MTIPNRLFFALIMFCSLQLASGQMTYDQKQIWHLFEEGDALFSKGVYEAARAKYKEALSYPIATITEESEMIRLKAEANIILIALALEESDAQKKIEIFKSSYVHHPLAKKYLIDFGSYYFDRGDYKQTIAYYDGLSPDQFNELDKSEIYFKIGYAHFAQRKFKDAAHAFNTVKDIESGYYFPTNYYLAMCAYFDGAYDKAIEGFKKVERSNQYEAFVPYYLCQIYFAREEYTTVTTYGEDALKSSRTKNRAEIKGLIGKSYFELNEFNAALPYLMEYSDEMSQLTKEEHYQVGLVQYKAGMYPEAIESLTRLAGLDEALGQNSNYFLGDCYVKLNQPESARAAFANARRFDHDPKITEESIFHYGQLSASLKYDREAINALLDIPSSSSYYLKAQNTIGQILTNTGDYANAINIIEKLPSKTPEIRRAYQYVLFKRAIQQMQNGNQPEAKALFQKSLDNPVDLNIQAQTLFWLGDVQHNMNEYAGSRASLDNFLSLKDKLDVDHRHLTHLANYVQGYNFLKQNTYTRARQYFQDAVAGIKTSFVAIQDPYVRQDVLGDALLRAGDCLFKINDYQQAKRYYEEAIQKKIGAYDYAIFQNALISGLLGDPFTKMSALESLANNMPNSGYADDALMELGKTYMNISEFTQATESFDKLVSQYGNQSPLSASALVNAGLSSYNRGDSRLAITYYKRVFEFNPSAEISNAAMSGLEEIYINDLGDADAYLAFVRTVKGTQVSDFQRDSLNFMTARLKYLNADYPGAIAAMTDYLDRFPNGSYRLDALYLTGESNVVLEKYTDALLAYDKLANTGPGTYYEKALHKGAIIAFNHSKNYQDAFKYYSTLRGVAESDRLRHEALVGALRSGFLINNMEVTSNLAVDLINDPLSTDEERYEGQFYKGKVALATNDYDNAIYAFNEVSQMKNSVWAAESRYHVAYIYYAQKELDLAEEMVRNSIQLNSSYPYWVAKGLILLSDILVDKRDYFNARAPLEALLENYSEDATLIEEARQKLELVKAKERQKANLKAPETTGDSLEFIKGGN